MVMVALVFLPIQRVNIRNLELGSFPLAIFFTMDTISYLSRWYNGLYNNKGWSNMDFGLCYCKLDKTGESAILSRLPA